MWAHNRASVKAKVVCLWESKGVIILLRVFKCKRRWVRVYECVRALVIGKLIGLGESRLVRAGRRGHVDKVLYFGD